MEALNGYGIKVRLVMGELHETSKEDETYLYTIYNTITTRVFSWHLIAMYGYGEV